MVQETKQGNCKMSKEPMHFDLVPADFTGDIDFQMMTAEQRGIYCTVIFYMYQNRGYCNLDRVAIATLCRCNGSAENFENIWPCVEKKFLKTQKGLTHSRVQKEYTQAKRRMQVAVNAGIKGAKERWGSHSDPNGEPVAKQSKVKVSKVKVSKVFIAPTIEQIKNYIKQNNYDVDAEKFLKYFTESNWVDSKGNKVKNWKQKIITWSGNHAGNRKNANTSESRRSSFAEQESSVGKTI
jgi:uncharacterized protein YdaU (DUF1376 family)